MKNRWLSLMLAVVLALSLGMSAVGCAPRKQEETEKPLLIVLDGEMTDGVRIPYAAEITLPSAEVQDEEGNVVSYDVSYFLENAEGERTQSAYPSFALQPGSYTIIYYYSESLQLSYGFSVVDEDAPVVTFTNLPNDLFAGETDYGVMPGVSVEDATDVRVDRSLWFLREGGETAEQVSYNTMNNTFTVSEVGVFTFRVTATDAGGNSTSAECSWKVKDPAWTAPALEEGYLADFSAEGYTNYVRSGDVGAFWNINGKYSDEWLEAYQGAEGVLKLELGFTDSDCTSINVRLGRNLTQAELAGKSVNVRVFVTGETLADYFGFAGIQKQDFDGVISAATIRKTPLVLGRWVTYTISGSEILAMHGWSDPDNAASDITNLQFCFQRTQYTESMTLYIDSIALADQLAAVTDVQVGTDAVTWTAVPNATGYRVVANGVETLVTEPSVTIPEGKGVLQIYAVSDSVLYVDSAAATCAYGIIPQEGEFASFDDLLYSYLISDRVNIGDATAGYKPSKVESSYADGAFTVTVGQGGWGICTALSIEFPRIADTTGMVKLVIRANFAFSASVASVTVYDLSYTSNFGSFAVQPGMQDYEIALSGITSLDGIQLAFQTTDGSLLGDTVITLDSIYGVFAEA